MSVIVNGSSPVNVPKATANHRNTLAKAYNTVSGGGACSACHSNDVCAIYGNSIDGNCSACSSPSSPSSPSSASSPAPTPSAAPVTALRAGSLSIVFSLIGAILFMYTSLRMLSHRNRYLSQYLNPQAAFGSSWASHSRHHGRVGPIVVWRGL